MKGGARSEYRRRLERRRLEQEQLEARASRISQARLLTFSAGVALAFAAFGWKALPPSWLLGPAFLFGALLLFHDQALRAAGRAARAAAFYEAGLARLDHRPFGRGPTGEAYPGPDHPYAEDLDLFGKGSLFELLCSARTQAGEQTLAHWLLHPAAPSEVEARQRAVRELRERLDLREQIALLGEEVRVGLHPERILHWGRAPDSGLRKRHRILAAVLVAATLTALGSWWAGASSAPPLVLTLGLQLAFALRLRRRVRAVLQAASAPTRELELLALLLGRLENESFRSPRLRALATGLARTKHPPSRQVARLRRWEELLDARRNQLFAPLAALLLWTTQIAMAIDAWRRRSGPELADWIRALGEFEALSSLAGHAFECPTHCFPRLVREGPIFAAEGLAHPLLRPDARVENDVCLGEEPGICVVSGSNMSGKSTWLRTLGINAVLAQAGGPVCARSMRLSPLQVAASIRVVDSLSAGESHFYAELKRVRRVLELAARGPVLFLLDELFHGTNSHDRAIGAAAVLRALLERGALGLITTHDLALARVADELAPRVANVHFGDELQGDRIHFDYRLRPGVVEHSNALALMRAVGIPGV